MAKLILPNNSYEAAWNATLHDRCSIQLRAPTGSAGTDNRTGFNRPKLAELTEVVYICSVQELSSKQLQEANGQYSAVIRLPANVNVEINTIIEILERRNLPVSQRMLVVEPPVPMQGGILVKVKEDKGTIL